MYNSYSEPMYPPMNHHKAHAGGHDVDYLQLPLPVLAGTSCVDSPSKTGYAHFQNPIAVGSVEGIVDLSQDVTDAAEFYQLFGGEAPAKSDDFISSPDDLVSSSVDFVPWPDNSGFAIDAPVTALDALTGFQAPVTDFDAIIGSKDYGTNSTPPSSSVSTSI